MELVLGIVAIVVLFGAVSLLFSGSTSGTTGKTATATSMTRKGRR